MRHNVPPFSSVYPDSSIPARRVLIVKTSALGDIIQSLSVLEALKKQGVKIDWVAEESFLPILKAHPLIDQSIGIGFKEFKKNWTSCRAWKRLFSALFALRKIRYDLLVDLQGNCKSGVVTFFAKAKTKVGFDRRSVPEWPNLLATNLRVEVSQNFNIREQYLQLFKAYAPFKNLTLPIDQSFRFSLTSLEKEKLKELLSHAAFAFPKKIMVCIGSKWANKQLPLITWISFLSRVQKDLNASFLLLWGDHKEHKECLEIAANIPNAFVMPLLSVPLWQNLMHEVDLFFGVDSAALHLCATTKTPSFSVFGPTSSMMFKPPGENHFSMQGSCPYGREFSKRCPILRTCSTGACIRNISVEELFLQFCLWRQLQNSSSSKNR